MTNTKTNFSKEIIDVPFAEGRPAGTVKLGLATGNSDRYVNIILDEGAHGVPHYTGKYVKKTVSPAAAKAFRDLLIEAYPLPVPAPKPARTRNRHGIRHEYAPAGYPVATVCGEHANVRVFEQDDGDEEAISVFQMAGGVLAGADDDRLVMSKHMAFSLGKELIKASGLDKAIPSVGSVPISEKVFTQPGWETVTQEGPHTTKRLKVPSGWLYRTDKMGVKGQSTFVPAEVK